MYVQRNDTYPTVIPRICAFDWLKLDFWINDPVAADTSYSDRLLVVDLPLCDVSAATGPCVQKSVRMLHFLDLLFSLGFDIVL